MNISQELRRTFNPASQVRVAKQQLNKAEWKEFQAITRKYEQKIAFEERAFELEHQTRVEVAKKRLINKAGSKTRDCKPLWGSTDRFDKAAINRQARREVRGVHDVLIGHLKDQMMAEREIMMERSQHRQKLRDKPKQDFARAVDRRSGRERRKLISRSRS